MLSHCSDLCIHSTNHSPVLRPSSNVSPAGAWPATHTNQGTHNAPTRNKHKLQRYCHRAADMRTVTTTSPLVALTRRDGAGCCSSACQPQQQTRKEEKRKEQEEEDWTNLQPKQTVEGRAAPIVKGDAHSIELPAPHTSNNTRNTWKSTVHMERKEEGKMEEEEVRATPGRPFRDTLQTYIVTITVRQ